MELDTTYQALKRDFSCFRPFGGILAWYNAFVTNVMLEGINNKIKVMKRKAYGYRDDQYFNLLLLGIHDKTNAIWG
ncbi:hypothetical protein HMPREF9420_1989 [Segatella salivae DSM 15606]|uniref:Transposase IS204/IS1001/IS1096/IS1165 DDE domain-containing protein n=1 Tax=Segatella salivae DSM 15606 TaxID=888832 RepID=E6MR71_9BACT|nr:hypothetical protein HMPREF9420_1989 [Segatella salivae DSM 15606]